VQREPVLVGELALRESEPGAISESVQGQRHHDDALRAELAAGRTAMEGAIMPTLIALGAPEPRALMAALAAAFEGMFLHRIARHADLDPKSVFDIILRGGLT
jgi:hypothetical protein